MQDLQRRALFRFIAGGASGIFYHDYLLAKHDGQVRAIDIYLFVSGELFSETLSRAFLYGAADGDKSLFAKLRGKQSDYCVHCKEIAAMDRCIRDGDLKKGVELFNALPASVQQQKSVLLSYLKASKGTDGRACREAIDKYAACYPGDTALMLILLDEYLLSGEFEKVHQTLDRVDNAVGGDPYIQVLHCLIYCRQKRFGDGEASARKAIAADPTSQEAYTFLVDAALRAKDFSTTTDALMALERQFSVKMRDLRTSPDYAEYVKSAEYQRWLKSHHHPAPK
jgi:hypothetical protein